MDKKVYLEKIIPLVLMLTVGSIESIFFSDQQNLIKYENKPKTKQKSSYRF